MSNKKLLKQLRKFIEEETDWVVTDTEFGPSSELGWELSQVSPAGEDFSFGVRHNNDYEKAVSEIKEYAYNFDVDEHIEMWIEARRNGVSGVPDTRTLVHDAEDIQEMLNKLAGDILTWDAHLKAEHVHKPKLDDVIRSCEEVSKKTSEERGEQGTRENKLMQMPGTEGNWGEKHWGSDKAVR